MDAPRLHGFVFELILLAHYSVLREGTGEMLNATLLRSLGHGMLGATALVLLGTMSDRAVAQPCGTQTWSTSDVPTNAIAPNNLTFVRSINSMVSFDFDGPGGNPPELVLGGEFNVRINGNSIRTNVAAWDGNSIRILGQDGLDSGPVRRLRVLTTGSSPQLYAVGSSYVQRWNGSDWSLIGSSSSTAFDVAAWDDPSAGAGREIYAGGIMLAIDTQTVNRLGVRRNGSSWEPLGGGIPAGSVQSLVAYDDDGDGNESLFVSGNFTSVDGTTVNHIAEFRGLNVPGRWRALGSGFSGGVPTTSVIDMEVLDDGDSQTLFVIGAFNRSGGLTLNRIARWNGSGWGALGSGLNGAPRDIAVHDDGSGPALYVVGDFTTAGGVSTPDGIAKWDGSSWSAVGFLQQQGIATAVAGLDDGLNVDGPGLWIGGDFTQALGTASSQIAVFGCNGSAGILLGDLNCDGVVNTSDIDPFVILILDEADYLNQYPDCNRFNGDFNSDGFINTSDIDGFVQELLF